MNFEHVVLEPVLNHVFSGSCQQLSKAVLYVPLFKPSFRDSQNSLYSNDSLISCLLAFCCFYKQRCVSKFSLKDGLFYTVCFL